MNTTALKRLVKAIIRFKVLHVVYWAYAFTTLLHQREEYFPDSAVNNVAYTTILTLSQMLCSYTIVYVLIPRLLSRQRYFLFAASVAGSIVGASVLCTLALSIYQLVTIGKGISNMLFITLTQ